MKFALCRRISEEPHITNVIEIRPLEAEIFNADRPTNMTLYANFANAPEDHSFQRHAA